MTIGTGGLLGVNFLFNTDTSGTYLATNSLLQTYQHGNFEMFSAQVPNSIRGEIIDCTVDAGLYPFASTW